MDNSNLWQNQPKPKKQAPPRESVQEALRQMGGGIGKTIAKDVIGKVGSDAMRSLFGQVPRSGELFTTTPEARPTQIRGPEFVRPPVLRAEEVNLKPQIDAVRQELKMLAQ